MTINPSFPIDATALLTGLSHAAMRQVMLHQAQEHELRVVEDSESAVSIEVPSFGQYRFEPAEGGIHIRISAALPDRLFMLKDSFSETLSQLLPEAAKDLRWSDSATLPNRPPNLHFTRVVSVTPVGTAFLRVRIQADDLSSFQDDAIHFRLLLPAPDCTEPEWPSLAENGATVWPKGEKALHRPAYTTRWIDRQAGLLDFDVFLHDGGRVTNWVRGASIGDLLVIAGPGGGGIPESSKICIFADETAFPAVARILEALPANSTGQVTLIAAQGDDCGYPITAPAGVKLTWLTREEAQDVPHQALAAHRECPDHFLWLASEKSDVTPVREALKTDKPAPGTSYIAAYWSKP
ncbi:siderophore-interacting protein [Pseudophaeobacter sp.]|uniref:siderophore-interacting protein n=1 Tax=Pseudophaeobacter sp. TaxID=1971739 RepID=UPI00262DCC01|nr:siderophore-interacting protein [Pseudophaeobacter sp.]